MTVAVKEALRKYAVAWFGFDEVSGNAVDKLGGVYVGTVVGATRVVGWNGEGNAIKATNINQIVDFGTNIANSITNKDFSIRFKIKALPNTTSSYFLGSYSLTSTTRGVIVFSDTTGRLGFGDITSGAAQNLIYISGALDDEWHDLLYSRSANKIAVWLDGKLVGEIIHSNGHLTSKEPFTLLNTNTFKASAGRFLNGAIDELQIYSTFLNIDDFTINKTLILTSGKYKTYKNGWIDVTNQSPTSTTFIEEGIDVIPAQINDLTTDFEIVNWTDEINTERTLKLKAFPLSQLVYPTNDISLAGVETIDNLILVATGNVKTTISFDSGLTWKTYKNEVWEVVDNAHNGMTVSEFNALTSQQIMEAKGDSQFVRFSYSLSGNAEVDNIEMKVSMQGSEKIANSSDYDLSYDEQNKTIVYHIKKSGIYSVNYVS